MRYMLPSNVAAAMVLPSSEISRNNRNCGPFSSRAFWSVSVRFVIHRGDIAWAGMIINRTIRIADAGITQFILFEMIVPPINNYIIVLLF